MVIKIQTIPFYPKKLYQSSQNIQSPEITKNKLRMTLNIQYKHSVKKTLNNTYAR